MLTYRNATATDIAAYYGAPVPMTLQAVVILLDGAPVGIVGLTAFREHMIFFSEQKPPLEPYMKRMPVLRAIKRVMDWARLSRRPLLSFSENQSLLIRLGFQEIGEGVYECQV